MRQIGCDLGQGNFFGRPGPAGALRLSRRTSTGEAAAVT
jgi:EAL domain-containing protein (putative c-di-GMP-specific phosphodiesterase class I)